MSALKLIRKILLITLISGFISYSQASGDEVRSSKKIDLKDITNSEWTMNQLDRFYSSKACSKVEEFTAEFDRMNEAFEERLDQLDKSMTESLVEQDEESESGLLFFTISRDYWPMVLPRDFPGKGVYSSCGLELMELQKSLSSKKEDSKKRLKHLDQWETCIRSNYREKVPPYTKKLVDCLKTIVRKN